MKNIILQTIRNKRIALIGFTLGGILLALMYVALFPGVSKQSEQFYKLLDSFPKNY